MGVKGWWGSKAGGVKGVVGGQECGRGLLVGGVKE